jgi:signal transduction histidine kinase
VIGKTWNGPVAGSLKRLRSWFHTSMGQLHPASETEGLDRRARLARNLLPPLILLVVIVYELLLWGIRQRTAALLAHLFFYGLLGPLVTLFVLQWIRVGIQARERAELQARLTYDELVGANRKMDAVLQLIRQLAEARDLEAVFDIAVSGAVQATGAHSGMLSLPVGLVRSVDAQGVVTDQLPAWSEQGMAPPVRGGSGESQFWEVASPVPWSGEPHGTLRLRYVSEPGPEALGLQEALAGEIGTAIEAARQRSHDLIALYQVDQSIRAERNMDLLLQKILQQIAQHCQAEAMAAYLVDQGVLRLAWAQDASGQVWHSGAVSELAEQVAAQRQPLHGDGRDDPVLGQAGSALGLPMLLENRLEGVLVLTHRSAGALDGARLPLLTLLASQATLAVRNARAYLYSEELAIGEERARIAREIHDGVAQSLAFAALRLDLAQRLLPRDPDRAQGEIGGAAATLREQIREVRRAIFALRPIDLERFGLLETVRKYVQDFGEQNNLHTQLTVQGALNLSPADEAVLFRILQESLNNVAKHAKAKNVEVFLQEGPGGTELVVRDDGVGFDPAERERQPGSLYGLGLGQMRERIELRGGRYALRSHLGSGTEVSACLPRH